MIRDEFSTSVKDSLDKRVAFRCSNPKCGVATSGPHTETIRFVNLGVASHITAAASGGPRFDETLTPKERASIDNGIGYASVVRSLSTMIPLAIPYHFLGLGKLAQRRRHCEHCVET